MKRVLSTLFVIVLVLPLLTELVFASLVLSPPKFEFDADPGQVISGIIKITNKSSDTEVLTPVVEDFVASGETGAPTFIDAAENDAAISISSWINVNDGGTVSVGPNQQVAIPFSINVPTDAEPGGHYGVIFLVPPTGVGQIGITSRIGALILVRVRGDIVEAGGLDTFGIYDKEIKGEDIPASSSGLFFESFPIPFAVRYENTGNIHLKPEGKIEISNIFGGKVDPAGVISITNEKGLEIKKEIVDFVPINDRRGNVLARSFRTYRAEWQGTPYWYRNEDGTKEIRYKGFPIGIYTAKLTLTGTGDEEIAESVRFIVFPWKQIFGGLILISVLAIGFVRYRRWSRARLEAEFKKKYSVKK